MSFSAPKDSIILAISCWLTLVVGCHPSPQAPQDGFFRNWRAMADKSKAYSSPGSQIFDQAFSEQDPTDAKEPPPSPALKSPHPETQTEIAPPQQTLPEAAPKLPTMKVTMKMREVDLEVLLRAMAKAANLNVMLTQNVKGKGSINIEKVPWNQAFLGVIHTYGLSYKWIGAILRIMSIEDIAREKELLTAQQEMMTQKKQYKLKMANLELNNQSIRRAAQKNAPLLTWIYHVKYADPVTLRENLEAFLMKGRQHAHQVNAQKQIQTGTPTEAEASQNAQSPNASLTEMTTGAVLVDPHTNSLVVQAFAEEIKQLKATIQKLDRPTAQVLIEATIVEANKATAKELGMQWGGLYHNTANGHNFWLTPGWDAQTRNAVSPQAGETANPVSGNAVNFPASTNNIGMSLGYLAEDVGKNILSVQLTALETDGKLNILSNPSITTLDNQKAIIESGSEVPFQTIIDGEVNIEFKKAVIRLEVTPYVVDADTIKLKIVTSKDELDFSNQVQGYPTIITKNAETSIVLFNGETTVIGGLSKQKQSRRNDGVPWLKDTPLIGYLFQGNGQEDEMEDLLIFITPHILKEKAGPQANLTPDK